MAEKKEKQYVSDNARLMEEWDWEKNEELGFDPHELTCGSGKKVWWKCSKGHEWEATLNNRTSSKEQSCPYCSNHRILVGFNDLATTNPELVKEWDYEKNGNITPKNVTYGSNKKIWWVCSKGHKFESSVSNRIAGRGCPFCSGKKVISGINDLLTKYPEIAKEWHPFKNGNRSPEFTSYGSDKTVWWLCSNGHEYTASPNSRTANDTGCPYCNGRKILKGYNDLKTLYPQLSTEWCYSKNSPITPDNVFPHSAKKYWWTCPICQTEYLAAVANRVNGSGCPKCSIRHHSSFAEQAIFFYVFKSYPDTINQYSEIFHNQMELDIYIPSLKTGIEYDGAFWHESEDSFKREQQKYKLCKELGIRLIRIREKCSFNDSMICDYSIESAPYKKNISALNVVIAQLSNIVTLYNDFDVVRDEIEIKSLYYSTLQKQSLSLIMPQLAMEWDYEKNGNLHPNMVSPGASDIVWWKCSKGHSWKTAVYNRSKGAGCPYCSGNKVITGKNDINSLYPKLMKEWDYSKNKSLAPETLSPGSNKHVWWICENGHSWKTSIYNRVIKNTGCPYCSNNFVSEGYNDLQTINPALAKEWNYEKNGNLRPTQFTVGSGKKVWWLCKVCGYEWEATINSRSRGNGCPECARLKRKNK